MVVGGTARADYAWEASVVAERPRELVNEGDVRRANGIADVGVGSLWLAVDLAERPSLGDVGAFVTTALVFFGAFRGSPVASHASPRPRRPRRR
jgi:hypothetical protein